MHTRAWTRTTQRQQPASRYRHNINAVATALAGLVLLAACGGGGSGDPSGSSGSGAAGSSSQNDPAKFAQCMRSHGVPSFPDPNGSGKFGLQVTKGGALDPKSPTFKSAVQSCHKYDTSFGNGSNSGSAASASLLKFAKCMRSHGVSNFPDPNGGRMQMGSDIRSNPHFNSAMQACRLFLSGNGTGSAQVGGGGK